MERAAKTAILGQATVNAFRTTWDRGAVGDKEVGEKLQALLKKDWKPTSAFRYAAGLRRFYLWAKA